MRLSAFAVLALLVTSGCSFHLVEQAAAPVTVAQAAPWAPAPWAPAPSRPTPVAGVDAEREHARKAPPPPVAAQDDVTPALATRITEKSRVATPRRLARVPFKSLKPEPRSGSAAQVAVSIADLGPRKVKRAEPHVVASADVTKAQ